ncbi:nitrogen regulation protein NR(II) [Spirosoma pollinicola]|uniref:Uncharacterized protein n=1 Tax=Spirosoma pollinicola TaxID=2057025 RepID=A0A2K8Z0E1_9BACT|nr:hypothetical protein [Spirosoma pollinicola]AUD03319.1 hypothetical protein CWM47_16645 [Spirosoma pollinicola]
METASQQHLQKLVRLLDRAPVAMAEINAAGVIRQVNPKAVQLMMPMAAYLDLPGDNLLHTLTGFLPSLEQDIANFDASTGLIVDQKPYRIYFVTGEFKVERFFSLTVEKISADSLLIFFDDVTDFLTKVDALRQSL